MSINIWICGFLLGLLLGSFCGICCMAMALCNAASKSEDQFDEKEKK